MYELGGNKRVDFLYDSLDLGKIYGHALSAILIRCSNVYAVANKKAFKLLFIGKYDVCLGGKKKVDQNFRSKAPL